jgi:hypothetical protein
MSGGTFDYIQHRFPEITFIIHNVIQNNDVPNEFGYATKYPPEILEKFKNIKKLIEETGNIIHTLDYFIDGDISEETFLKDYGESLEEIKKI